MLHSKIYFSKSSRFKECARGAKCLVGSANLSSNAFNCNEEILAEILDDETKNSIENYIDSILSDEEHLYSLRDLINKKRNDGESFNLAKEIGVPENSKIIIKFISSGYLFFQSRRNFSIRQVFFCKFMHKKQIFPFPSRLSKLFLPSIPRVVPSVASR